MWVLNDYGFSDSLDGQEKVSNYIWIICFGNIEILSFGIYIVKDIAAVDFMKNDWSLFFEKCWCSRLERGNCAVFVLFQKIRAVWEQVADRHPLPQPLTLRAYECHNYLPGPNSPSPNFIRREEFNWQCYYAQTKGFFFLTFQSCPDNLSSLN